MKNKMVSVLIGLLIVSQIVVAAGVEVYAVSKPVVVEVAPEEDESGSNVVITDGEDSTENSENQTFGDLAKQDELPENYENITISTVDELISFAKNCSLDTWSRDKYVTLAADIAVGGSDFDYIPTFGGVFDGKGHSITGIKMQKGESYTGLFCVTQASATIQNLSVSGYVVPGGKQIATGGIVGDNYGSIINCFFDGTVEGYDYSGAITGYNEASGLISGCKSSGIVTGMHSTGGIAGENYGIIRSCENLASINTSDFDEKMSIEDISVDQYTSLLKDYEGSSSKDSTSAANSPVDAGGICGRSAGIIELCSNSGAVGYEHVGYNIGGIVGRQSGYVRECKNYAVVLGRKDVGGICGQAEPYVVLDLSGDIVSQLSQNIDKLHDLLNITLTDAGNESSMISGRLNTVKMFTDLALDDTSYLSSETEIWVNGVVGAGNEVLSRADYAMDEVAKDGGVIDQGTSAGSNVKKASENLANAVNAMDIERYLNDAEKAEYNQAKNNMDKASKDYEEAYKAKYDANYAKYNKEYFLMYIGNNHNTAEYYNGNSNLKMYDGDGNSHDFSASNNKNDYSTPYESGYSVKHSLSSGTSDFPASETDDANNVNADTDSKLNNAATAYGQEKAGAEISDEANNEFKTTYGYGVSYDTYMTTQTEVIARLYRAHITEIEDKSSSEAEQALQNMKDASANLESAGKQTKDILSTLNGKSDVSMPTLSPEYQRRTASLVANIQGMSDNLGYLNNDMNSANQNLIGDMKDVNDQFNVIMMLFTDAVDGVLEMDYSVVLEDYSRNVAEECTDGTVADCINYGAIKGDIDVAGIAGTMAIEYDFDLESDVTGIDNAKINSTYQTKCVLRNNRNDGNVTSQKSYAGGITGLQEMGTILRSHSFGKIESNTADYVGGIAGQSLATIRGSYTKGIFSGRKYVGGIAGSGDDIEGCYSIPTINNVDGFFGAIAGNLEEDAVISGNYFCSENLAGINRISYSGKAEPISFNEINRIIDVSSDFKSVRVFFVLDDEVVEIRNVEYGSNLYKDNFPEAVSSDENMYADWNVDELKHITEDTEVIGESQRYVTTLAGVQLRENKQSAVLVDGRFTAADSLYSEVTQFSGEDDKLEIWMIGIPEDNLINHTVRYQKPDGVEDVKIVVTSGTESYTAEVTEMGRYLTFNVTGKNVKFTVYDESRGFLEKYWYYIAAGAAAVLLIVLILFVKAKRSVEKRRSKTRQEAEKKLEIEELDEID